MLNQGKTDQLISKTDLLEDKLDKDSKKNHHDLDAIKHILKQLQDRMNKMQNANPMPPSNDIEKLPSSKNTGDAQKEES